MSGNGLDRRGFLRGVAGTAALAGGGGTLLSACGKGSSKKDSNEANTKVKLPTLHPFTSVKPDLPGDPTLGVQDGYLKYPAKPVRGIKEKPGNGGSVTALVISYTDPPPPESKNRYWQALNDRLGVKLNLTIVPISDYISKLATTIAGGDLPDFLQLYGPVSELPALLAAKCQDLTKYLSGNAVTDYPYLASIPADYWKSCVFNGGIYGLPIPRSKMGGMLYRRDDLIKPLGVNSNPTSFAEFKTLCKELTDLRHNRWALASAPLSFVQQMLGCPNGWELKDGKLSSSLEAPGTKQAIGAVATLVKAGYVHPDSFAQNNTTTLKQWFNGGNALMHFDNYTAWPGFYQQNVAGKSFTISGLLPPNFDGGSKAITWQGNLDFSFTALKKGSDARVKELLRVANWIAAPFGTAENVFLGNGLPGVHYNMQNGVPVRTTLGNTEINLSTGYLSQGPSVLSGQYTQATKDAYEFEKVFLPKSVANPTQSVYSDTYARKWATLNQNMMNAQNAIMQGHKPLSSWDDAVSSWKSGGGDQIRHEFEQALQKS